ncbi:MULTISPECIES: flavin-containing monooxygenase [Acidiphilium]|uniref:Predicted flavoprotein CzcO associated with the cation diffusion facilitator CzcD n=1 Tax=Acidiphilium rubrum TaxID=526 RepID=A0A8G2FFP9_ACIRU|nr:MULTISPECIES: NAD(P)/FAD-dependent oxidoreductase [Acidiphilium]SIQ38491.1 Predicted flavoprotein CzcO associated with the cation diffusion facilitator CzcD [Acidiphilium rubrum]
MAGGAHFDVVVVGGGLSGIGAACHLTRETPERSYVVLEGRDAIGGTWDLFRYPGIRSDSDMYTLGYSFRPWTDSKAIAPGPAILNYVRETAREFGVDRHIRFGHHVKSAAWDSARALWTVTATTEADGKTVEFTCNFLFMCSGYYDYDGGHLPAFPDAASFGGRIVHPQSWPADLDYVGKRIVVIGSGATAVTLVPELAKTAAHVTMLQRSPTYIVSRPSEDAFANRMRRRLPAQLAYGVTRWRNVLLGMFFYNLARRKPERVKAGIIGLARQALGPDYDVATHFTPRYKPWDQRLCLVPDGDLFTALKSGAASIVTDQIERFTSTGIALRSGATLAADIIVAATGLKLKLLGGLDVMVDGKTVDFAKTLSYKGMMISNVPNFAVSFGYTNASWTLKSDLTAAYVCRLLNHMKRHNYTKCTPLRNDPSVTEEPFLDFTSGYVQRAIALFPRQGSKKPWRLYQNYVRDLLMMRWGKLADGTMAFTRHPRG